MVQEMDILEGDPNWESEIQRYKLYFYIYIIILIYIFMFINTILKLNNIIVLTEYIPKYF